MKDRRLPVEPFYNVLMGILGAASTTSSSSLPWTSVIGIGIAVLALVAAVATAVYARRQARASEDQATAADASAKAAVAAAAATEKQVEAMAEQTRILREQLDRELTAHLLFWSGGGSNGPNAERGVYIHNAGPSTASDFELFFQDEETDEQSPASRYPVVTAGEKLGDPIRVHLGPLGNGVPGTLRLWASWTDGNGRHTRFKTDLTVPRKY